MKSTSIVRIQEAEERFKQALTQARTKITLEFTSEISQLFEEHLGINFFTHSPQLHLTDILAYKPKLVSRRLVWKNSAETLSKTEARKFPYQYRIEIDLGYFGFSKEAEVVKAELDKKVKKYEKLLATGKYIVA